MSIYLDASFVVSLFVDDSFQRRADIALRTHRDQLVVSDFSATEFASAISRRVGARLATFDDRMAASAAALGVAVVQA